MNRRALSNGETMATVKDHGIEEVEEQAKVTTEVDAQLVERTTNKSTMCKTMRLKLKHKTVLEH